MILEHPLAHWLDFSYENVMSAMKIAHESVIRINDALISTHAMKANAAVLTDNVRYFEKVKSIKIIRLRSS